MSETDRNYIKAKETAADHIHGATRIRPGDEVKLKGRGRWSRVVEVYPSDDDVSKLAVHRTSSISSSVDRVYAEAVTDWRGRD